MSEFGKELPKSAMPLGTIAQAGGKMGIGCEGTLIILK
jgi:hypothetical protein